MPKTKQKMKIFFLFCAFAFSLATTAQVTKISLQASGLTCSMCSNSIHKALKTLDFVEKIDMDIKTYTFNLTFKVNRQIDFDKIKKKVEDAGFSVSGFIVFISFDHLQVKENKEITIGDQTYLFVNVKKPVLNGIKEVRVLNKGFVSPKEYNKRNFPAAFPGIYLVTI